MLRPILHFTGRAALWILGPAALLLAVLELAGCASVKGTVLPLVIPTPEQPRVACIGAAPGIACDGPACREFEKKNRQNRGQRVLLPEIVLVIGLTSPEDGERWKVLRNGERDPEKWLPYSREEIVFDRCGAEAEAYSAVMLARQQQ